MDKHLLKNTAQRLNVYDENVLLKAEEYVRLYQTKASVKTLNDQTKIVLCLDLASESLGKGCDKETALQLCGLKKSAYQNSLNTLEKILGLDKTLTVSDLCVQLGCSAVKEDAQEILDKYVKVDKTVKDLEHPQYAAAAAYLACKAKKISIDKPKIVTLSRLKPGQWKELITNFENLGLGKKERKLKKLNSVEEDMNMDESEEIQESNRKADEEVEDYEVWKERILKEAFAALKNENSLQ